MAQKFERGQKIFSCVITLDNGTVSPCIRQYYVHEYDEETDRFVYGPSMKWASSYGFASREHFVYPSTEEAMANSIERTKRQLENEAQELLNRQAEVAVYLSKLSGAAMQGRIEAYPENYEPVDI